MKTQLLRLHYLMARDGVRLTERSGLFASMEVFHARLSVWSRNGYTYSVSESQARANAKAVPEEVFLAKGEAPKAQSAYVGTGDGQHVFVLPVKVAEELSRVYGCSAETVATSDFLELAGAC